MIIKHTGSAGRLPSSRLPSEYQEVEYIESSGTQYIDTGLFLNNSDIYKVKSKWYFINALDVAQGCTLYGCQPDTRGLVAYYSTNTNFLYFTCGSTVASSSPCYTPISTNTMYEIEHTVNSSSKTISAKVNSINLSSFTYSGNMPTNETINVFRNSQYGQYTIAKLYYFEIYNNNTLVRNFIPCYRKSDTTIGLYDLVNGVFYTNQGTGTFSKGNDVKLTDLYTEVEYIQSNGTQYINTNLTSSDTFEADIKVNYSSIVQWRTTIVFSFKRNYCNN